MNKISTINEHGEVLESDDVPRSMAVQLQKAEIDQQVSTAKAYPRSIKRVQSSIMDMATLDEQSADECIYALPRGGKPIKGPSIRFAEILKQAFGNCRSGSRVVEVNKSEMYVEAEGVFHDLETNSSTTKRVRRRISDKRGQVFKDDMIIVTGNAACSIALRNAILDGVPKPLWRTAYQAVEATIAGDITTLSERRTRALKHLAAVGLSPDQVYACLAVEGEADITVDNVLTMRGMYSALKNGEATVEEMIGRNHQSPTKLSEQLAAKKASQTPPEQPQEPQDGFNADFVQQQTSAIQSEPQPEPEPIEETPQSLPSDTESGSAEPEQLFPHKVAQELIASLKALENEKQISNTWHLQFEKRAEQMVTDDRRDLTEITKTFIDFTAGKVDQVALDNLCDDLLAEIFERNDQPAL